MLASEVNCLPRDEDITKILIVDSSESPAATESQSQTTIKKK